MKKPSNKILRIRKLAIRTETIALLTPLQLTNVAGGVADCSQLGTCSWPKPCAIGGYAILHNKR